MTTGDSLLTTSSVASSAIEGGTVEGNEYYVILKSTLRLRPKSHT